MSDRGEFEFIAGLAERLGPAPDGQVGVGDDAAVLADGTLVTIDTLVADTHFRLGWTEPEDVGWKALVVNLSDLAAMGGEPTAALAAVTLPPDAPGLADRVTDGLLEAAEAHACPLVGGDTTSGPILVVTVAVLGRMSPGRAPVLRVGAAPGDGVHVTGTIGAAAGALDALVAGLDADPDQADKLHRPQPQLAAGQAAVDGGASAMIDVSDGLAADLGHVLDASSVGVEVQADSVPVAAGVALDRALGGGDDYELCFTAPDAGAVARSFAAAGLDGPTRIGTITEGGRVLVQAGRRRPLPAEGWSHPVD